MEKHIETKFDGKKAIVIAKDHPHYNAVAICKGADRTCAGLGMKFEDVNTYEEFYVFNGKEIQWVNEH